MNSTRPRMMISSLLLVLALPGCLGLARSDVLPDRTIPHETSRDQTIYVWARQADGSYVEEAWAVPARFVLFAPELLTAPPAKAQP